jgi:large subunit ribosomal protein L1
VAKAVQDLKGGKVEFRVEKAGIVHVPVGRVSFGGEKLSENITSVLESVIRLKPSASKGVYLRGMALSTTMGPGVKLDVQEIAARLK